MAYMVQGAGVKMDETVKSIRTDIAKFAAEIDLRGLRCPLPVLQTQKRLKQLTAGDRLRVLADDPLAGIDIAHLCREEGHRLIAHRDLGEASAFVIEVGEGG